MGRTPAIDLIITDLHWTFNRRVVQTAGAPNACRMVQSL